MNTQDIKTGSCIMLFIDGHSIAYATNHTFNLTGNTTDISTKDHGEFGAVIPANITWEVTSENLYTHASYFELFDAMIAKEEITIVFGEASDYDPDGLDASASSWTAPSTNALTGKAYITSLAENAPNGETATFSVTLTGSGPVTKLTA